MRGIIHKELKAHTSRAQPPWLSIYLSSIHPKLSSICISIYHSIYLSITYLSILVYHLSIYPSIIPSIYLYLWSISDAVILTLMVWSSGSMVLLPLRHRQRAVHPHPYWTPQMPPGDQSRPHHPDAGGHPRHLLPAEFCVCSLYHSLFWYSSVVDTDL